MFNQDQQNGFQGNKNTFLQPLHQQEYHVNPQNPSEALSHRKFLTQADLMHQLMTNGEIADHHDARASDSRKHDSILKFLKEQNAEKNAPWVSTQKETIGMHAGENNPLL